MIDPTKKSNENLANFTELLTNVQTRHDSGQQAQQLMAAQLAPHFSPFNVYRSHEADVSRHLALLLDPEGTHEQGSLFWDAFVNQVLIAETSPHLLPTVSAEHNGALEEKSEENDTRTRTSRKTKTDDALVEAAAIHPPIASDWLRHNKMAEVETEHCTRTSDRKRFINLCVHLANKGGIIAIENKPWRSAVSKWQTLDAGLHRTG